MFQVPAKNNLQWNTSQLYYNGLKKNIYLSNWNTSFQKAGIVCYYHFSYNRHVERLIGHLTELKND